MELFEKCVDDETFSINYDAIAYVVKNIDDPESNGISIIFELRDQNQSDNFSELSLDKNSQIIRRLVIFSLFLEKLASQCDWIRMVQTIHQTRVWKYDGR